MARSAFNGLLGTRRGLRGLTPEAYADLRRQAQTDDVALAVLQDHVIEEGRATTRDEATLIIFPLLSNFRIEAFIESFMRKMRAKGVDIWPDTSAAHAAFFDLFRTFMRQNYLAFEAAAAAVRNDGRTAMKSIEFARVNVLLQKFAARVYLDEDGMPQLRPEG